MANLSIIKDLHFSRAVRIVQLALLVAGSVVLLGLATPSTVAASGPTHCTKPTFFGLEPWYQYIPVQIVKDDNGNTHCDIASFNVSGNASGFLLIALALLDDLLRIAGLVAIGYTIFGGFKYITSQGEPSETAAARSTILYALIGLAVALIAVAVVSFIGSKLG